MDVAAPFNGLLVIELKNKVISLHPSRNRLNYSTYIFMGCTLYFLDGIKLRVKNIFNSMI